MPPCFFTALLPTIGTRAKALIQFLAGQRDAPAVYGCSKDQPVLALGHWGRALCLLCTWTLACVLHLIRAHFPRPDCTAAHGRRSEMLADTSKQL